MKNLVLFLLVLNSISTFSTAQASCSEVYAAKADRMVVKSNRSRLKAIGVIGVVGYATFQLTSLPAIPLIPAFLAHQGTGHRMEFFSSLIKGANQYVEDALYNDVISSDYIPKNRSAIGQFSKKKTIFDRLENEIKKTNPDVTNSQILEAIALADLNEDFCHSISKEKALKTNIKSFSKVVIRNL